MFEHRDTFRITLMSRVLKTSRSGYYAWCRRRQQPSARQQRQAALDQAVAQAVALAFTTTKGRYGALRLVKKLADTGQHYNRKTIANRLRRQGLRAKAARKFKATTQSNHSLPVAPNRLEQDFSTTGSNQKWGWDITYLWTDEGWLNLAVVIDLYARKVVGWAMPERMTAHLVCDALQMALWRRKLPEGVIVHTDRGVASTARASTKVCWHGTT